MEVNTQSLRCTEKRSVLDAINFTGALAHAHAAQDVSLFQSHILRVFRSKSEQAQLQSVRRRYHVPASIMRVLLCDVLLLRHPLKVVGMIVRSVMIFVMDNLRPFRSFEPADCDQTVNQSVMTRLKIAIWANLGYVRRQLSQNFPGPRHGIQVIEESKFNFVNNYALHGFLPENYGTVSIPEFIRKC